jgi:hypothetical protein
MTRTGAVLLSMLFLAGCGAEASSHATSGALPSPWLAASGDRVVVGWAMRPEDVVSCMTAARELRQLRAHFGDRVVVSVVVPEKGGAFVESFLRTERLQDVRVHEVDRRSFDASFGTTALPAIYVVHQGVTRLRLQADRAALTRGDAGRLEEVIGDVVQQFLPDPQVHPSPVT